MKMMVDSFRTDYMNETRGRYCNPQRSTSYLSIIYYGNHTCVMIFCMCELDKFWLSRSCFLHQWKIYCFILELIWHYEIHIYYALCFLLVLSLQMFYIVRGFNWHLFHLCSKLNYAESENSWNIQCAFCVFRYLLVLVMFISADIIRCAI